VMGPDEYHEIDPKTGRPGLKNNSYTNVMVAWLMGKALQLLEILPLTSKKELISKLGLTFNELERWDHISKKMTVIFHEDGVMTQFEGWENLKELDFKAYKEKYGNIQRIDRILKAEGDSPDNYKVCKQADTCMIFYLLTHDEVIQTLTQLGYAFNTDLILRNIRYYMKYTTYGSTLSFVVYSFVLYPFDPDEAWKLYKQFVLSDIADIQGGTVAEGIHVVPMAASVTMLLFQLCGIDTTGDMLRVSPHLTSEMEHLEFRCQYKHKWIHWKIFLDSIEISLDEPLQTDKVMVKIYDEIQSLLPGSSIKVSLKKY